MDKTSCLVWGRMALIMSFQGCFETFTFVGLIAYRFKHRHASFWLTFGNIHSCTVKLTSWVWVLTVFSKMQTSAALNETHTSHMRVWLIVFPVLAVFLIMTQVYGTFVMYKLAIKARHVSPPVTLLLKSPRIVRLHLYQAQADIDANEHPDQTNVMLPLSPL
jgi:hypothetical protein